MNTIEEFAQLLAIDGMTTALVSRRIGRLDDRSFVPTKGKGVINAQDLSYFGSGGRS